MIKPGIWTLTGYRLCPNFLRRHFLISYGLLTETGSQPEAVELFEALIRELRLSSGVYRTTFRDRFAEMDATVNQYLGQIFPMEASLIAHDWAASDCLVAGQWASKLGESFPNMTFHASDKMLYLAQAKSSAGKIVITETDGTPLQYIHPPFVISYAYRDSAVWMVNAWIRRRGAEAQKRLRDVFPADFANRTDTTNAIQLDGWTINSISLVHPEFRSLLRRDQRISVQIHSVFDDLATPAHVIRTMNILSRSRFDDQALQAGYRAVQNSLVEGGVWIVGGQGDTPNITHASVYRKKNGTISPEFHFGQGYFERDLVSKAGRPFVTSDTAPIRAPLV